MAFGDFFKKKANDDFSDFSKSSTASAKGLNSRDLALPPDGDITNTMPSAFGEEVTSQDAFSPTFSKLQDITRPQDRFAPHPTARDPLTRDPLDKDMQLINAKLDAIKSSLDSLGQRVANLERIAEGKDPAKW